MVQRPLPSFVAAALAALAAACAGGPIASDDAPADDPAPIDDGVKVRPPVRAGATVTQPDGTVGKVTETTPVGPYREITVSYPARWSCPANWQAASGSSSPVGGVGPVAPGAAKPLPRPEGDGRLAPTTCAALADSRRPALLAQAEAQLASARASVAATNCTPVTEVRCVTADGTSVGMHNCRRFGHADAGAAVASGPGPTPGSGGSSGGATQYSTTNNQVASVDEADFVKNDGKTIYVLSQGGLNVVEAWPAASTRQVARVPLPGEPRRLFLDGSRLVVFTRLQATAGPQGSRYGAGMSNPSDQGCTYGYDCRFSSEGGHTLALVFDVTTPASPRELARYELSGGFVASRRVGPVVYTVVHDSGAAQVPGVDTALHATSYDELMALYERRRAENARKIAATEDAYFLPWMQHALAGAPAGAAIPCDDALVAQSAAGMSFISVVAFDLTKLEAPVRTLIGSDPGYVYGSPTALYMAVDRTPAGGSGPYGGARAADSVVHKFRLDGTRTRYAGSAVLPGHVLNQFAMDEQDGVLRVASTRGWVPDPNVVSFVSTYGDKGGTFAPLGELGGIAPTEDIRSVRFDGDRGYVVTFKKTDPLFVFDLADPARPRKLGELKIPGYSTYMHRLDKDHLLAVGFDADDKGSFAYFSGVQIQIFDVSDPTNPTLKWKKSIGTRGSTSEGLLNHLAFNYFAPKKVLALPMTVCEGGSGGSFGDKLTFSGLMVFDVSLATGITERGRLPFTNAEDLTSQASCGSWWTDARTLVKRSVFMDDFTYGIADQGLRVAPLSQLDMPVQSLTFTR